MNGLPCAPQILIKALPLMVGWFALNVPSGLGLYYLSNTVLSTSQQIFLRKFSGAMSDIHSFLSLPFHLARRCVSIDWRHAFPPQAAYVPHNLMRRRIPINDHLLRRRGEQAV